MKKMRNFVPKMDRAMENKRETKNYKMPAIVWLKITDYMHPWLQHELGCALRIKEQKVVCVQHLPGARDILMEETVDDTTLDPKRTMGACLSDTRKNCYAAGLVLDPEVMERQYGVTQKQMDMLVPIECPKMCITKYGVLRPWTLDTTMSKSQAMAMQKLLRQAFWDAVSEFSKRYAREHEGEKYAQVEMIEAFCEETETPDLHVESMRREWQRRQKRQES